MGASGSTTSNNNAWQQTKMDNQRLHKSLPPARYEDEVSKLPSRHRHRPGAFFSRKGVKSPVLVREPQYAERDDISGLLSPQSVASPFTSCCSSRSSQCFISPHIAAQLRRRKTELEVQLTPVWLPESMECWNEEDFSLSLTSAEMSNR